MTNDGDYPRLLMGEYAERKITREEFIGRLAIWQTARGIDYTCRGLGDENGIYVEYRHHKTRVRGGALHFVYGTARNGFEFRRKVDIAMNRAATWAR